MTSVDLSGTWGGSGEGQGAFRCPMRSRRSGQGRLAGAPGRRAGAARLPGALAAGDVGFGVQAVGAVGTLADLAGLAALGHALVALADGGAAVDGDPAEARGVAPVG